MATGSTPTGVSRNHARALFAIGIGFAMLLGLLGLLRSPPVERLDHWLLDAFVRLTAREVPARDTLVIDIDDVSLSAVGQWPWPRYRIAALIERIAAEKPAAIALDILFPEADRASLTSIQQTFKRDFGVEMSFSGVPSGLLDNDGYLGSVIARAGVVGANYFYFDHAGAVNGAPARSVEIGGRTELLSVKTASGALVNAPAIASQTVATGFVNSQGDADGVLRRAPLLIRHDGVLHPNLALAALLRAHGSPAAQVEATGNGPVLRVAALRIPIDESGLATMRFNGGPGAYRSIPALDVLGGGLKRSDVEGKIVFVGTTAVGLNDFHTTAVDPRFPGLKVQSAMVENMLHDGFVRMPSWAGGAVFAACLLSGALVAMIFVFAGATLPIVAGHLALAAALFATSAWLFARDGLFVSAAAPLFVVATLFVAFLVARYALEKRRARVWLTQLENARKVTMESMAAVAETRDPETGAHIKRTQHYVRVIAQELRRSGLHPDVLTDAYIDLLFLSAPLHDIGKVGVPDHILLKPGRLTPDEMVTMKQHAEFGRKIIFSTAQGIEGDNFLVIAGEIAATHHEKWDGSGYPLGLGGEDIPLSGRIMAVADIYDALISRRCYKEPYSHVLATTLMTEMRGTTFDPAVLDAFFRIESRIKEIAIRYKDPEEASSGLQLLQRDAHEPVRAVPAAGGSAPAVGRQEKKEKGRTAETAF